MEFILRHYQLLSLALCTGKVRKGLCNKQWEGLSNGKKQVLKQERTPEGHGVTWRKSKLRQAEKNKLPVPGPPEGQMITGSYTHGQQLDHPACPFRPAKGLVIYQEGGASFLGDTRTGITGSASRGSDPLRSPLTSHPSPMCPGKGSHLCWAHQDLGLMKQETGLHLTGFTGEEEEGIFCPWKKECCGSDGKAESQNYRKQRWGDSAWRNNGPCKKQTRLSFLKHPFFKSHSSCRLNAPSSAL